MRGSDRAGMPLGAHVVFVEGACDHPGEGTAFMHDHEAVFGAPGHALEIAQGRGVIGLDLDRSDRELVADRGRIDPEIAHQHFDHPRAQPVLALEGVAAPGRQFPAVFREARGQADSSTQTFEAHFSFTPPPELLVLTGMTATLFYEGEPIDESEGSKGVEVPLAAVMSEGGKRFVWVAKGPDKVLERREIKIEDGVGETLRAITGLKAGETIVAAGGNYFREGDKVRPWGE